MSIRSKPLRMSGTCISCGKNFFFADTENFNGTTNCSHCGELLLIRKGRVYLMSEWAVHKTPGVLSE